MAGTTLTDVIVPELFNPYVTNKTMELSAMVQSGIVQNDAAFDALASQDAPVVNMPFWNDLSGESEQIVEGQALTPDGIKASKDMAVVLRRAKMWSATDLSAALSGSDPTQVIGNLVASFWSRDMQKELIALLQGVFGSTTTSDSKTQTLMADHILDISTKSGNASQWSASAFIDAEQLLGDAKTQLTGIVMHSATQAALKKQNLIETVQPSSDVAFNVYQGKRVIVDDGCPASNGVYTTYLFGDGAIALGNGSPVGFVPTETDRDKKYGSGTDYLINRKTYILHPRGISWTNAKCAHTEGPSRTEFADPANWKPVYEPKQIRIVEFKHKLP